MCLPDERLGTLKVNIVSYPSFQVTSTPMPDASDIACEAFD
jgi:hypothetical protein